MREHDNNEQEQNKRRWPSVTNDTVKQNNYSDNEQYADASQADEVGYS